MAWRVTGNGSCRPSQLPLSPTHAPAATDPHLHPVHPILAFACATVGCCSSLTHAKPMSSPWAGLQASPHPAGERRARLVVCDGAQEPDRAEGGVAQAAAPHPPPGQGVGARGGAAAAGGGALRRTHRGRRGLGLGFGLGLGGGEERSCRCIWAQGFLLQCPALMSDSLVAGGLPCRGVV